MNIGKFTILTNNISYLVCLNEFNIFLLIKHKAVVQYFWHLPSLTSSFTAAALFVFFLQ